MTTQLFLASPYHNRDLWSTNVGYIESLLLPVNRQLPRHLYIQIYFLNELLASAREHLTNRAELYI